MNRSKYSSRKKPSLPHFTPPPLRSPSELVETIGKNVLTLNVLFVNIRGLLTSPHPTSHKSQHLKSKILYRFVEILRQNCQGLITD